MDVKKVVVCDDDRHILEVLKLIVEFSGAEVLVEDDSAKLYGRLHQDVPDLLIIDLWMPNLSGQEVISRIRRDDSMRDMYILCLSASDDGEEVAMRAGANQFLPKPFDMTDILQIIERNCSGNRASA
ncbi:response regulator [Sphingobacterium paludis]|jgi:DNA-binding response OmpR family regulator|uniref:Two-component system alkaline phosphatase synthesis response regulator PhoP/two-component system cell cycle response regulator DivK n=1 Tax=Sphingobacterium paludis TaxID=1476465 RepID=A0A4R7CXR0_9SPHI|nr:response regulator [Sphingobacterium paludis]TDS11875.1 two-component system alkaline phosphatase synthesis response regulator PhoP/two-component system cell cycle response regulator DivK [Sphingobacterium paludis]